MECDVEGLHEERHVDLVEGHYEFWVVEVAGEAVIELVKNHDDYNDKVLEENGIDEVGKSGAE